MAPYLSFLLSPFIELLQHPNDTAHAFGPEQLSVVQALSKSMTVDEGSTYHPYPTNTIRLTDKKNSILARRPPAASPASPDTPHRAPRHMCTRTRSRRRGARSGARSARRYRDGRRTAQAAQYGRVDAYALR